MVNEPRLERIGKGEYRVSGELSFDTVTALRQQGMTLLQRGDIVLDLSTVSRADSAGLALLVEWLRLGRAAGRTLRYRHIPPQLWSIAEACGIDRVLPLADEPAG